MHSQPSYQVIVTRAVARALTFAKDHGWRIIKNKCLVVLPGKTPASKPKTCVCPMMALWLEGLDEKTRARTIKKGAVLPETLARNLGKRLNVHPQVIQQFMGTFDDQQGIEKPWLRSMSELDINRAVLMEDIATNLRKKLRPKAV